MGLADRCTFVAGDFFGIGTGWGRCLHPQERPARRDDERASAILHNCRRAVAEQAKLLLVERVLPSRFEASAQHHDIAWMDPDDAGQLGGENLGRPSSVNCSPPPNSN